MLFTHCLVRFFEVLAGLTFVSDADVPLKTFEYFEEIIFFLIRLLLFQLFL